MLEQKDIEILAQLLSQSTSELEKEIEEWEDESTEETRLDIQNFHKRLLRRFEELEASTCGRLDECNAQLENMLEEIKCDRAEANLLTKHCEE